MFLFHKINAPHVTSYSHISHFSSSCHRGPKDLLQFHARRRFLVKNFWFFGKEFCTHLWTKGLQTALNLSAETATTM